MRASILSIGDELTLGQNLDTNSAWLASKLAEQSIMTVEHRIVSDDRVAIALAISDLAAACEVVITTGGLGPTADDLTREAMGDVLTPGQELVCDDAALKQVIAHFTKRRHEMPHMNRKQAQRPANARCLPNPNGTAPGLAGELGRCQIFCLPGPPREMQPMFLNHVMPAIKRPSTLNDEVLLTASVHEFGMGESKAAEKLGDLMARDRNPLVGTTASDAIVSARIRVRGPCADARRLLDETVARIEQLWHPYAFGRDGATLIDAVAPLLRDARKTLVTAESCTGGWLGKSIVDRPKSSEFYLGGWVTYADEFKQDFLGVPHEMIETHGAVSACVAQAMSDGALNASSADYSLAITGIAGPDGGTTEKPVGTVFIGLGQRRGAGSAVLTRHFHFPGDRQAVRDRSVKAALQMLRFALLDVREPAPLLWEVTDNQNSDRAPDSHKEQARVR